MSATNGKIRENGGGVPVLPSLITLGSILCGFGAIGLAAYVQEGVPRERLFSQAAWLILLAMLFDALDGRIARLTQQASDFGGHLDSLSDVISFGMAPAFLAWQVIMSKSSFPPWAERLVWLTCGLYVVCAALRLARFDTSSQHEEEAHRSFQGLPTPPAAGMIASLVILHGWLVDSPQEVTTVVGRYVLPLAVLFLGPLMISKLHYVHLMHEIFKNRRSFPFFVEMIFGIFLVVALKHFLLPLIFAAYVLSGLVGLAIDKLLDRLDVPPSERIFFK